MIYLVKAEETNLYKIGYTAGTAEARIKSMQTGCPHKLHLVEEVEGCLEKEKWLHEFFSKNRKQGEWFEFDEKTVEKVCTKIRTEEPKPEVDLEGYRDMYEKFIRNRNSCDYSIESFIYVAILEIMLGNKDTAIQRLREFQTLLWGGSYLNCIPPLTETILDTEWGFDRHRNKIGTKK